MIYKLKLVSIRARSFEGSLLTHPALARPVRMLPPMTTVVFCADAEIHDPTTPKMAATMMNHLLPNRSPNDPRTGPKANVIKKLALAIQEALLASPRLMTWKRMMVLVWLTSFVRNIKTFGKDV